MLEFLYATCMTLWNLGYLPSVILQRFQAASEYPLNSELKEIQEAKSMDIGYGFNSYL